MPLHPQAHHVLTHTDALPVRHQKLHRGKVRALYQLTPEDSARLIQERGYNVPIEQPLGVMITSNQLSAFDCNWQGKDGLGGVPRKGTALNQIVLHWFMRLAKAGIAQHHILEVPHPLL